MGSCSTMIVCLLCLVILTVGAGNGEELSCPDNWVDASQASMGCVFFSASSATTWDTLILSKCGEESNKFCQDQEPGGALLQLQTAQQLAFLKVYMQGLEDKYWWLGATDLGREGQWFWISNLNAVEDIVWTAGTPTTSTDLNCLALNPSFQYAGFDFHCGAKFYPLCQII